jgi:hypothetical protein
MTYLEELRVELAVRGIRGRLAHRIELELADHLACSPDSELGSPALVADRFVLELGIVRTRRATFGSFGALALTAIVLGAAQRAMSAAGGWPTVGGVSEPLVMLTGVAMFVACQVSFVAGVLGATVAARRRSAVHLMQRRMRVGIAAGAVTVAGQAVLAILLRSLLPGWWVAMAGSAVVVAGLALAVAARSVETASSLTACVPDELVSPLPAWLIAGIAASAVVAVTAGTGFAEGSVVEGLIRGAFEAAAIVACFRAFGRRLGLRAYAEV